MPTLVAYYTLNRTLTHILKKLCFSRPATIDGPIAGKHYKYGSHDDDDDDDDDISIAESIDTSR